MSCGSSNEQPAQSVILITCDTLRADHLGVYGYAKDTSPNLDRFAKDCVVFDKAYASAALTAPALTSLMTGRTPDELGMATNRLLAPAEVATIAEVVQAAGIRTKAIVSNWVLRKRPGQAHMGLEQGFDSYDDKMEDTESVRSSTKERVAAKTTDAAIQWIDENQAPRFFLWVHYQDPHGPYSPPAAYFEAWQAGGDQELTVGKTHRGHREIPRYQVLGSERHPDFYRSRYDSEIRYFDDELGRFLEALDERELGKDALILFTADHGESLGEHKWWFSHGHSLYEELVRVPFLIRFPEGFAQPSVEFSRGYRRVNSLVGHLDVLATVTSALGIAGVGTHGTSLLSESITGNRIIPQSLRGPNASNRWEAVTEKRFRLIETPNHVMLFDLVNDPGELNNLAADHPERVQSMQERLEAWKLELAPVGGEASAEVYTKEQEDELQRLGY